MPHARKAHPQKALRPGKPRLDASVKPLIPNCSPQNCWFFWGVERFIPATYGISGGDSYLIWDDCHETIQLRCEHVDAADASEPTRIAIVAKDWLPNLFVLKHGVDSKLFWVLIQDV